MVSTERKLGRVAKNLALSAPIVGMFGFSPFGGDLAALDMVTDLREHVVRTGDFQSLNPFGGITLREVSSITPLPNGNVDATWHNVYHPYNHVVTANMLVGDAALLLLATAAGFGIASGVTRLRRKMRG